MQAYGGLRQKALPIPITDYTGNSREREKKIESERWRKRERAVAYAGCPKGIRPPAVAADFRSAGSSSRMRPFSYLPSFAPSLPRCFSPRDPAELARENSIHCPLRYLEVQLSRTARKKKKSAQKYCEKMRGGLCANL